MFSDFRPTSLEFLHVFVMDVVLSPGDFVGRNV